jgi:hypothetical protein
MTRFAIALSCVLLLAVAFLLQEVDSVLLARPVSVASVGSDAVAAAVIFALTAVIPLVIWACLRFEVRRSVVPLMIWGGLVIVASGAGIVASNARPILTGLMEQPSVKKGFRESFIPSAKKSCVASAQANRSTTVSDGQIDRYCDCSAEGMADDLTADEFIDLVKGASSPPPSVQAKLIAIVQRCQAQVLQRR